MNVPQQQSAQQQPVPQQQVRALSEELENPMNVHRWRKLEGSDPATYELVQKIHILQARPPREGARPPREGARGTLSAACVN